MMMAIARIKEKSLKGLLNTRINGYEIKEMYNLLDYIDTEVCFKYINAVNVYIDILNLCLSEKGFNETNFVDKKIISYVEFGAYNSIMFYFINRGIYRDSAIILKEIFSNLDIVDVNSIFSFDEWENICLKNKDIIIGAIDNSLVLEEFKKLIK